MDSSESPRSAAVRSPTSGFVRSLHGSPCSLAVIDTERLDAMLADEPRLGLALLASLSRRLSLRLRQVSARLSALLSQN